MWWVEGVALSVAVGDREEGCGLGFEAGFLFYIKTHDSSYIDTVCVTTDLWFSWSAGVRWRLPSPERFSWSDSSQ